MTDNCDGGCAGGSTFGKLGADVKCVKSRVRRFEWSNCSIKEASGAKLPSDSGSFGSIAFTALQTVSVFEKFSMKVVSHKLAT
jgi:hypothetical protein